MPAARRATKSLDRREAGNIRKVSADRPISVTFRLIDDRRNQAEAWFPSREPSTSARANMRSYARQTSDGFAQSVVARLVQILSFDRLVGLDLATAHAPSHWSPCRLPHADSATSVVSRNVRSRGCFVAVRSAAVPSVKTFMMSPGFMPLA